MKRMAGWMSFGTSTPWAMGVNVNRKGFTRLAVRWRKDGSRSQRFRVYYWALDPI
jgi:hypothetical protein